MRKDRCVSSGGVRGGVAVEFYESAWRRSVRPRITAERKGSVPKRLAFCSCCSHRKPFGGCLRFWTMAPSTSTASQTRPRLLCRFQWKQRGYVSLVAKPPRIITAIDITIYYRSHPNVSRGPSFRIVLTSEKNVQCTFGYPLRASLLGGL